jgi:transcriptional regulator with XRE-family HTH domain
MTQVRLSIELEVSQETISAYESGKHYPSVVNLIKIAALFHTSCDYILGLSPQRYSSISSELSTAEQYLLDTYRRLPNHKQERLTAFAEGLSL